MEHIVQFAIGIDDEAIQKRIQESGYDDVIKALTKEARNGLANTRYASEGFGGVVYIDWGRVLESKMKELVEENKDEIIEKAAEKLCDSYMRTKKFKERMAEIIEEE